jgi:hypothetical protein
MIYITCIILSAILYRIGGMDKKIIPFANSQFRDIGCPIVVLAMLVFVGTPLLLALAASALVLLFIRTYHDYTGSDNMFLHGLFIGASMFPLYWSGSEWYAIVIYAAVLALSMGILNIVINKIRVPFSDWIEELFRGAVIILALPILLI